MSRANFQEDIKEAVGKKYGMLTILGPVVGETARARVEVRCDCGTVKTALWSNVKRKNTISCGCWKRTVAKTRWGRFTTHKAPMRDYE